MLFFFIIKNQKLSIFFFLLHVLSGYAFALAFLFSEWNRGKKE